MLKDIGELLSFAKADINDPMRFSGVNKLIFSQFAVCQFKYLCVMDVYDLMVLYGLPVARMCSRIDFRVDVICCCVGVMLWFLPMI